MKKFKLYILETLVIIGAFASCSKEGSSSESSSRSDTGKGGSTARFVVVDSRLYTVDNATLHIFDLTAPNTPIEIQASNLQSQLNGSRIETIFAREGLLFLGTDNGVHIFNISNPDAIEKYSVFSHIVSCDPVVANDSCAFSTLNNARVDCARGINCLDVISLKDIKNPVLIKSYEMKSPNGLGLLDNKLFVCDDMVKIYDVSDPSNILLKREYVMNATDVIPLSNTIIFTGSDGLRQYIFHPENDSLEFASRIIVTKPVASL